MEYKDVIETRRSIRSYLEKEVELDLIQELIEEAMLAPSAYNRQPWKFQILKQTEKNWIASTMEQADETTKRTALAIQQSPVILLVMNTESESRLEDLISIGGMIEQFSLSATNRGLGTLWMTHPLIVKKQIEQHFHLNGELVSIIALGYPEFIPNKRPRKEFKEVLI